MKQPNILLITTDQQRHDTCGPHAPSFMRTPHFDILANEGVSFSRAYSDCPLCVPARTTIMTGKFATTHGLIGNGGTSSVMGRENTLPTLLRTAGYSTCAIGKMHFGPQRVRHGFDEMILLEDYYREMERSGHPQQPMRTGLDQNEFYPGMATVPEPLTLTSWIAEQSLRYIRERRDPTTPFFLWCSFSKPHPPLDPPEPYYSMYQNADISKPVYGEWAQPGVAPPTFERHRQTWLSDRYSPETIRAARAAYYGLITQIDYNMGRVLAGLNETGLYNDTLIIYTSDHGEALGDHGATGKAMPYDNAARVPFVLRPPKSWNSPCAGTQSDKLITLADILPTLVHAGSPGEDPGLPSDIDGKNILDLLDDDKKNNHETVLITCYSFEILAPGQDKNIPGVHAITDGRWKYIWYPEGPVEQLFDLESDPYEEKNLSEDDSFEEERSRLRGALLETMKERGLPWLHSGELPSIPAGKDTARERRFKRFPGFISEWGAHCARH